MKRVKVDPLCPKKKRCPLIYNRTSMYPASNNNPTINHVEFLPFSLHRVEVNF